MLWHRRQSKKELKARGEEKEHVERPPRKKVSHRDQHWIVACRY